MTEALHVLQFQLSPPLPSSLASIKPANPGTRGKMTAKMRTDIVRPTKQSLRSSFDSNLRGLDQFRQRVCRRKILFHSFVALLHSNGHLRTERDGDTEKGCQKPALQQNTTDDDDDDDVAPSSSAARSCGSLPTRPVRKMGRDLR